MIVRPSREWPVIAAEPTSRRAILLGYVVPLAALGPVFTIGFVATHGDSVGTGVLSAVLQFSFEIVNIFVIAFVADALVKAFGGAKDSVAAFKWVSYASTPRWLGSVLVVVPYAGPPLLIALMLYSIYVLYLGAAPDMRVAPGKGAAFTLTVLLVYVLAELGVAVLLGSLLGIVSGIGGFVG